MTTGIVNRAVYAPTSKPVRARVHSLIPGIAPSFSGGLRSVPAWPTAEYMSKEYALVRSELRHTLTQNLNATVAKVASGAADTVPYFMVTNLARTLNELKERGIWIIGTSDDAPTSIYQNDFKGPVAWVLGAEGEGMRQLTRKTCDQLVRIPMQGAVESLNVSVASGVCLYESLRQRSGATA